MKLCTKLLLSTVVVVWGTIALLSRRMSIWQARARKNRFYEGGGDVQMHELSLEEPSAVNDNKNNQNNYWGNADDLPKLSTPFSALEPVKNNQLVTPAPASLDASRLGASNGAIPSLSKKEQKQVEQDIEEWAMKKDLKAEMTGAEVATANATLRAKLGKQLPEGPVPTTTPLSVGPGRLAVLMAMHHSSLKPGHTLCAHAAKFDDSDQMKLGLLPCDDYDPDLHEDKKNADAVELEWRLDTKKITVRNHNEKVCMIIF